jgi:putative ABC transport system permease protein
MSFYNLLLHLYPSSFRNEYGGEMRAVFERKRRSVSGAGTIGLWLAVIGEVIFNAAAVHLDILKQDAGYTGRMLRRSPGFAVMAVAIVALGIGATTAAFSVTDFVLLRPLPFPEPDPLVAIWETTPGYGRMEFSAPNYRDWTSAAKSFESTGVYYGSSLTLIANGEARRIRGTSVSATVFSTLGVSPILGRAFSPEDDREGAAQTMMLSYQWWLTEFGGDRDIVGRSVSFADATYTILGVMPPSFHFPRSDALFWTANRFRGTDYEGRERTNNWLNVVGRLRRGVTLEQARAEMRVIAAQSERQFPKDNKDTGAAVLDLRSEVSQRSQLLLVALMGAAACVLLIACANLANLLLARALARRRELAVRAAMGAGRERLVRQLMTENLLLAVIGGGLGVGTAVLAVPLLSQLIPTGLPIDEPAVDIRVLLFAIVLTALTGVVFGLAPIMHRGSRPDLDGLREGARAGGGQKEHLRSVLVVTEIVASVVLLVSAGLLIRALMVVQGVDPGFRPEGVLTLTTHLPMPQYRLVATREDYYSRVLQDVRALPGVTAAGFISFLPMSAFRGGIWPVTVPGDASAADDTRSANNVASIRYVTDGFFQAMGMPIKRGRAIDDRDGQGRQFAAVVSESFVRRYWPDQDPIGKHFTFAFADREVVGVVGDVRVRGLERSSEPQVYLSSKQVADGAITFYSPKALAVRTTGDPAALAPSVRSIIRRIDPKLPITELQTLTQLVDLETASRTVQARVLAAFAIIAFVLAAVGIHGLLSFAVSQRTQEIGVRIALGAQRGDILSMVGRRLVVLSIAGVLPGLILAYIAGRSMEALLAGVKPADAMTMVTAMGLAVVMTVLGGLVPTLRALRVDPIVALRAE